MDQIPDDIVHTWLFAANSFGRAAALMAKTPVIIGSERCVDPWKSWWHFSIDRFLSRRSAAITTNSPGIREFYAQHGIQSERWRGQKEEGACQAAPQGNGGPWAAFCP